VHVCWGVPDTRTVATLTPVGTRLTVHVYNDESDVDAAPDVLRG